MLPQACSHGGGVLASHAWMNLQSWTLVIIFSYMVQCQKHGIVQTGERGHAIAMTCWAGKVLPLPGS